MFYPVKWMFSLILLFLQVSVGTFASLVGATGGPKQSSVISRQSSASSRSLKVQPSAKGGFPRFSNSMAAPSINVGAGGKDAKTALSRQAGQEDESLLDKVGKMLDKSEQEADEQIKSDQADECSVLRDRTADEPPNPKKRMFEESPLQNERERVRDEL